MTETIAPLSEPRRRCAAADWLSLAAAPTFAAMALLTGAGGAANDMLCSAAGEAALLSGMMPMYLLMSAFHSAPWLKLLSSAANLPREDPRHAAP